MKRTLILVLAASLLLGACTMSPGVEYDKVAVVDLGNLKKETCRFNATILFQNLSEESFTVRDMVLDLKVDGQDIGTILVKPKKTIRPHSEFSIPSGYTYPSSKVLKAGEEPSDVYLVQLEGYLTLSNAEGEAIKVPVKYKAPYAYLTQREERKERRMKKKEQKLRKAQNVQVH